MDVLIRSVASSTHAVLSLSVQATSEEDVRRVHQAGGLNDVQEISACSRFKFLEFELLLASFLSGANPAVDLPA